MSMATHAQGWIYRCRDDGLAQPMGPRCAITDDGDIVCVFMLQSKLGVNDFVPMRARSKDNGRTWTFQGAVWPHLSATDSIFCSLSRSPAGQLFLFGTRTRIGTPGEPNWQNDNHGLKENTLIWAQSDDGGFTWTEPRHIPVAVDGAAESTGPIGVDRHGRWHASFAPYHTFDTGLPVVRNRIVAVRSADEGQTWTHRDMMSFTDPESGGAESWIVPLPDGSLLGTCWHFSYRTGNDYPNQYALSTDGGETWSPHRSTGIRGQSTALTALPDGRAAFLYNFRKTQEPGIGLAIVKPSADSFGIVSNGLIWRADTMTQSGADVSTHDQFTDYAFGEPSAAVLPDGSLFVVYWCVQPAGSGIAFQVVNRDGVGVGVGQPWQ